MDNDFSNSQLVGMSGHGVTVMFPKRAMSADEAMIHAAWLVTIAGIKATLTFEEALAGVQE